MSLDLVIRNGTVYDGTGAEPIAADVAIAGRPRSPPSAPSPPADCPELDAAGLAVAPGFIDIHSHSDYTLLVDPRARERDPPGRHARGRRQLRLRLLPDRRPRARAQGDLRLQRRRAARVDDGRRLLRPARARAAGGQRAQPRAERPAAARDRRPRRPRRPTRPRRARMQRAAARVARRGRVGLLDRARVRAGVGRDRGGDHRALPPRSTGSSTRRTRAGATRAQFESVEEAIRTAERAEARLQVSHLVPRNGIEEARRSIGARRARPRPRPRRRVRHAHAPLRHHAPLRGAAAVGARRDPATLARAARATRPRATACAPHRSILSAGERLGRGSSLLDNPFWPEYARRDLAVDRGRARPGAARRRLRPARPARRGAAPADGDHPRLRRGGAARGVRPPVCVPGSDATTLAPDGPLAELVLPRRLHVGLVVLALHGPRRAAALARRRPCTS